MAKRLPLVIVILSAAILQQGCNGCNQKCGFAWFPSALVSQGTPAPASGPSGPATASLDGRFVAFGSMATNLVSTPATDGTYQVYLRDTCTGSTAPSGCQAKTVLVSVTTTGAAPTGCFGSPDIIATLRRPPSISQDGRFVLFESSTCDLGFGGSTTSTWGIYLRDTCSGPNGPQTAAQCTPHTYKVINGVGIEKASLSGDAKFAAFKAPDGANGFQIFVADLSSCLTGAASCAPPTTVVSLNANGKKADSAPAENGVVDWPQISPDGRFVVFTSRNTNLGLPGPGGVSAKMQVFVADDCLGNSVPNCTLRSYGPFSLVQNSSGQTEPAADDVVMASVASGGHAVAFASKAGNLPGANGNMQVYFAGACSVPPAQTSGCSTTPRMVSTTLTGQAGTSDSSFPSVSPNGEAVAFESKSTNFVPAATNNATNVYVSSTCPGSPQGCVTGGIAFGTDTCKQPTGASHSPIFTPDNKLLVLRSDATDLFANVNTNTVAGVYVAKQGQ